MAHPEFAAGEGPARETLRLVQTQIGDALELKPITPPDLDALFQIFDQVVRDGEGYPQLPPLSRDAFHAMWVDLPSIVIGAFDQAELVGAYYLRPNGVGRAAHIANAGYVVEASRRRRGIGRCLVQDSIDRAPAFGFDAIQFNFVFESNPARSLYEDLGFRLIGSLPDAVGPNEAALIYWRAL